LFNLSLQLAVLLLLFMALHDVLAVADGQTLVEASVITRLGGFLRVRKSLKRISQGEKIA
jgi:hypothetical protein